MEKANQYVMVDYANSNPTPYSHNVYQPPYGGYYMGNYLPYNYSELAYPHHYLQQQQYLYSYDYQHVDQAN